MGFLDTMLGRTKPTAPNLDRLFGLPAAAITLQTSTRFHPTGVGSVCFKAAEGGAFTGLREQVEQLLALDEGKYREHSDSYGFTWLVRTTTPDDLDGLVTDLHAVNSSLVDAGFGAALLCTLIAFTDGAQSLGLVYLYKRGSWYPFAPTGRARRDTAIELQIKSALERDLRVEDDLARWFPLYDAPGL
ncbi:MAG: hypothetical protein ABJA33_07645 [Pedococcus sp.]